MKDAVAVLNCGNEQYQEDWNGNNFAIPAGKAITMKRRDAITFLGRMSSTDPKDPAGAPIPKKLKIVPLHEAASFVVKEYDEIVGTTKKEYTCNYDGKVFTSQEALDAHLNTLTDKTVKPDDVMKEPDKQDPAGMVTCPFCNKADLKGAMGLQNHIKHCPKVKSQNKPEATNDNTSDNIFTD